MIGHVTSGQDNTMPLGAFAFHVKFSGKFFSKMKEAKGDGDRMAFDRDAIIGGFSQISGLEASMEPKTIRSGGDNYRIHQRVGAVSFGTVTLKRGIIRSRHIWRWWADFIGADQKAGSEANGLWSGDTRPDVSIMMIQPKAPPKPKEGEDAKEKGKADTGSDREAVLGWKLESAMPVKFRIGDLDATSGELAIEELHLAHQGLHMLLPESKGGGA